MNQWHLKLEGRCWNFRYADAGHNAAPADVSLQRGGKLRRRYMADFGRCCPAYPVFCFYSGGGSARDFSPSLIQIMV